jgi:hypothetical protein
MREGLISILQILMLFSLSSSTMAQKSSIDTLKIHSKLIGDYKLYEDEDSTKRVLKVPTIWEWVVATPGQQGLDSVRLAELTGLISAGERFPRLHSLLIIRHGYLVVEEYFNNWKADQLHTLQSVSKSFTSALVGIAIARGGIQRGGRENTGFFSRHERDRQHGRA